MQLFSRLAELEAEHATYALATVVARSAPVSSHLGDRALIFPDGHMEGFVGGSCSRDIVRRHALGVLRSGKPQLLRLRPSTSPGDEYPADDGDLVVVPMSCASEGAVDVYIEPHIPLRSLVIAGFTPIADALARLAASLDYQVVRVTSESELRDLEDIPGVRVVAIDKLPKILSEMPGDARMRLIAVVASQGHYDEAALEALLAFPLAFVGLLASRKRAATVVGILEQQGMTSERTATIRNPVGLDIGARSPGEVAISILAEIIATALAAGVAEAAVRQNIVVTAVDAVCGMDVETAHAQHRYEHGSKTYYFCCAGCRIAFANEPARYLAALGQA